MSVTLPLSGQVQNPVSTLLTTTNQTDVFTASDRYTEKVIEVHFANDHSSAVKVTLEWFDGTSDHKLFIKSISANDTVTFESAILLSSINATQKLKATVDTANQVTATVIFLSDLSAQRGAS